MDERSVRVTFAAFGVGGQEPRQDFEMRMKVRKKQLRADARCQDQNYDMETTSDAGSVRFQLFSAINPRDGLSLTTLQKERKVSLINESISTWSGCDFAVDLAGDGFKADDKVDGERGFVLIRDTSTNHTWTVFSNIDGYLVDVTFAQLPSLSFARPAHCRNKTANDEGKWICSDYFNMFADDLQSGRKVVEIFATSGFSSNKLHIKMKK
jgi:hypothetical protein